jgi:hypothetical protein
MNRMADAIVRYGSKFYQLLGNRRKFERLPLSGAITAKCSGYCTEKIYDCACLNISPRGIGIVCAEPMAPPMYVHLYSDEQACSHSAIVRYCINSGNGFRIGLEFISEAEYRSGARND